MVLGVFLNVELHEEENEKSYPSVNSSSDKILVLFHNTEMWPLKDDENSSDVEAFKAPKEL